LGGNKPPGGGVVGDVQESREKKKNRVTARTPRTWRRVRPAGQAGAWEPVEDFHVGAWPGPFSRFPRTPSCGRGGLIEKSSGMRPESAASDSARLVGVRGPPGCPGASDVQGPPVFFLPLRPRGGCPISSGPGPPAAGQGSQPNVISSRGDQVGTFFPLFCQAGGGPKRGDRVPCGAPKEAARPRVGSGRLPRLEGRGETIRPPPLGGRRFPVRESLRNLLTEPGGSGRRASRKNFPWVAGAEFRP